MERDDEDTSRFRANTVTPRRIRNNPRRLEQIQASSVKFTSRKIEYPLTSVCAIKIESEKRTWRGINCKHSQYMRHARINIKIKFYSNQSR